MSLEDTVSALTVSRDPNEILHDVCVCVCLYMYICVTVCVCVLSLECITENPSGRTMPLGSTQSLTETSTRSIS
jgi:hypothetical protein